MDNQKQNQQPGNLEHHNREGAAKPAHKQTDNGAKTKENNQTPQKDAHWQNESFTPDGLVDREIGEGSEDLNYIDDDDDLSTK